MEKKKGFTLVELLVAIIIIGIITVLALPGIGQLQARNRNKKFEAYKDSMESGGKLYTDSYSDDMFGMEGSGCYDISYSELRGKNLIKDYEENEINCNHDKTFIQVRKENNKYSYAVSLYCTGKDGKVVYDEILTSCVANHEGVTDVPWIDISYRNKNNLSGDWSTSKDITIKVSAVEGLADNITIRYGWSTDPNVAPTSMKTYNYRNDFGKQSATMTFEESGKNGEYYLFVEGDDVIDTGGRFALDKWSTVMKFDNTPPVVPVLNNPRNNIWTGIEYVNANKYVIGVTSSDAHSGVAYYQYRYPNSEPNWVTYNNSVGNSFTTPAFTKQRDENVEIRACDYANNCSSPASNRIRIDLINPTCSINKNGTMGTNDWYRSNVTVKLSVDDTGGSRVSAYDLTTSTSTTYNGVLQKIQGDTSNVRYYGYVKDGAENISNCSSAAFKVDATAPAKPTLSISGSGTLTVVISSSDATSGIAYFSRRISGSGAAFSAFSEKTNPLTISTSNVLEIKAVDNAGNASESAYTVHCNTSGGTLTYEPSYGWICVRGTIRVEVSGVCNHPYCCEHGYDGNGHISLGCTRQCDNWVDCTSYRTGCVSGFSLNGSRCIKRADGL